MLGIGINEVITGGAGFETLAGKLSIILSALMLVVLSVVANLIANYLDKKKLYD